MAEDIVIVICFVLACFIIAVPIISSFYVEISINGYNIIADRLADKDFMATEHGKKYENKVKTVWNDEHKINFANYNALEEIFQEYQNNKNKSKFIQAIK